MVSALRHLGVLPAVPGASRLTFHSPCPRTKAYGLAGLMLPRRPLNRSISPCGMGNLIICSTEPACHHTSTIGKKTRHSLVTSKVPAGQVTLLGSFLITSPVLKMPCIEQALTLN